MQYIKYIWAIVIGFIGCNVFRFIVIKYVLAISNANSEDILINGMFILSGLIIACTALIIFTIKEHDNR
jgi:hypothetical protein